MNPQQAFQWRVGGAPAPAKDYMSENYRKLKNIAAEGQRKRFEPLKAKFIPGVTKNDRYAHIQSKVGANLRGGPIPPQRSCSDELANRRMSHSQRFVNGGGSVNQQYGQSPYQPEEYNGNGFYNGPSRNSRLSRSSVDLRSHSVQSGFGQEPQQRPLRRQGSISASGNNFGSKQSIMTKTPDFQILQPNPPNESIYKWKFNEESEPHQIVRNGNGPDSNSNHNFYQAPPQPVPGSHRVEYIPCDGICAEETIVDNLNNHPDSARSSSSRTSRGCNTEETRIFPETRIQEPYQFRGMTLVGRNASGEDLRSVQSKKSFPQPSMGTAMMTNGGGDHGVYGNGYGNHVNGNGIPVNGNGGGDNGLTSRQQRIHQLRVDERNCYPFHGEGGSVVEQMNSMSLRDGGKELVTHENRGGRAPGLCKPANARREVGAGDATHEPGTIPKYLKQRQEEWRIDAAAKKEAEESSHIPNGYVLMSEDERIENLRQFQKNYQMLIEELNRVPITVDTIRVKSHKAELERQLTRLEDAMKTFSRPKVWLKTDD